MDINITNKDIKKWLKLAETNVTMRSKLLECATVYALAEPDNTKISNDDSNGQMSKAEREQMRQILLSHARYG